MRWRFTVGGLFCFIALALASCGALQDAVSITDKQPPDTASGFELSELEDPAVPSQRAAHEAREFAAAVDLC